MFLRDRSCLSYWFPVLSGAGLPVPKTQIVRTELDLLPLVDQHPVEGSDQFLDQLKDAARSISQTGPWFLRTGQGSGKHNWRKCCAWTELDAIKDHVASLVEWSYMVDFFGLPTGVWAVREMLPVNPVIMLPLYEGMPLVREIRAFVESGKVVCAHDYWPRDAVEAGMPPGSPIDEIVSKLYADSPEWQSSHLGAIALASQVARLFDGDGAWSVDLLQTERGWYVTDMADARESYHWVSCENSSRKWAEPTKKG